MHVFDPFRCCFSMGVEDEATDGRPNTKRVRSGSTSALPLILTLPRRTCCSPTMASAVPNAPTITVLYFAAASTATGLTVERVPLPLPPSEPATEEEFDFTTKGFPLNKLADLLSGRHAGTGLDQVLSSSSWAVNEEMVDEPEKVYLKGEEEVAVICPVSGG